MKTYIATFFSHFGSICFKKACDGNGLKARVMPVPRNLSSSCGTCVRYEASQPMPLEETPEEIEQIVEVLEDGYAQMYRAEDI